MLRKFKEKWVKYLIPPFSIFLLIVFKGCEAHDPMTYSGVSASGYSVGIAAIYGESSLPADSSSQATIRVDVWNQAGQYMDGVPVTLTSSLGTLGAASLTTSNGSATTTFTAGSNPGKAYVIATVENVSATATIVLATF